MSPPSAPAYRVDGPGRVRDDPARVWALARVLTATDWKVRFFGSALGYAWSLLRPLLLFAILYVVFNEIVGLGDDVAAYAIQLLVGMTLYFFFNEVTSGALTSLVDREALVRKVGFPRMVVPLSVGMLGALSLALNGVVLAVFLVIQDIEPRLTWLLLPLPLIVLAIGALGTGLLLSALYVRFRDIRPIWDVILQVFFYATPILYPAERLVAESQTLATVLMLNPLAALVQTTRRLLIGPDVPSAAEVAGGAGWLLVPAALIVAVVAVGIVVFERTAPRAAEDL